MIEFFVGLALGLSLSLDPVASEQAFKAAQVKSSLARTGITKQLRRAEKRAHRLQCRLHGYSDYGLCGEACGCP